MAFRKDIKKLQFVGVFSCGNGGRFLEGWGRLTGHLFISPGTAMGLQWACVKLGRLAAGTAH